MRHILLFSLLPHLLSASIDITSYESVTHNVKNDVLQTRLNFEEHSVNEDEIKHHFNAIIRDIKRSDPKSELCRGGGYQITPSYSYKNQKQDLYCHQMSRQDFEKSSSHRLLSV